MWKSSSVLLATSTFLACGTAGDSFHDASVLAFSIQDEVSPSRIDEDKRQISVRAKSKTALRASMITQLVLSSQAKASIKKGDILDLSQTHAFTVTAEDGTEREWNIIGGVGPWNDGGPNGAGGAPNPDDEDELDPDCPTRVVTYALSGVFEITNTPLGGAGDGTKNVGPGKIQLRFINKKKGPAEVRVLSYEMKQQFTVSPPLTSVRTDVQVQAGPDICGLAQGHLEEHVVQWAECDYGPAPPHGETKWGSENIVGGPGCLNGYHSTGLIECSGIGCGASGVDFPINQDETYAQPLNWFEFNEDLSQFTMTGAGAPAINKDRPGVELPSVQPSRTWLALTGTELESSCEPLPSECQ